MRLTLQQIRDRSPCREGWTKLLKSLGNPSDMSITVSIGEIARSNGPQDALWCLRCAEFDRRDIIRAILPSVKRAAVHITDQRVSDCIALLERWLVDETVTNHELQKVADAVDDAVRADQHARRAWNGTRAFDAVLYAVRAAADAVLYADVARAFDAVLYADVAFNAAAHAFDAVLYADVAELENQIEDICAVFP